MNFYGFIEEFIFQPLQDFFLARMRLLSVRLSKLSFFCLGVALLVLLMLASTNYLINFLAAFGILGLVGLVKAVHKLYLERSSQRAPVNILTSQLAESLLYVGLILHYSNQSATLFCGLATLTLLGSWLSQALKNRLQLELNMPDFEIRLFLLALSVIFASPLRSR